jgi:casein kinase 1 epsilon
VVSSQGASRTAEDGERRGADERDERIVGGPRGSAARGLPPGPTPSAANRVRNGPEQAISNPASRVQQSGEHTPVLF